MKMISAITIAMVYISALQTIDVFGDNVSSNAAEPVSMLTTNLTEIEKLWPQEPDKYFVAINQEAGRLAGLTKDSNARKELQIAFTNMVAKPLPADAAGACLCLTRKCDAILQCLNSEELRNDKASWIAIAKYIGEIRSQIIPNYKRKGYANPPGAMAATPEKSQQAIQKNVRNRAEDELQQELLNKDRILTFFLMHNAGRLVSDPAQHEAYLQEIKSLAHLTEDEQRQL